ncbi:hypothetical protein HUW51_22120 [Adhaeribacter swui]|uniref:Uncharacterized protein n=1 Tax=Adhaeribacter swui TaxID=2086471 RepID=A0A7G7GDP8_9BACT|nr:hypothetical protein [Adhaeribacter swui]QNF35282.1 hypothetical protein HUW51_22120 [Adhaeribacter swui]
MLNLKDFNHLTHLEKMVYLKKWGTYLAIRHTSVFTIKLYYVHNFYVELYFRNSCDKCEYIGNFEGTTMLEPYLKSIKLNLSY